MAAKLTDAQLRAVEQQLQANPQILDAIRANQQKLSGRQQYASSDPRFRREEKDILKSFGIDFPDAEDYHVEVDPSGAVKLTRQNFLQRNLDWIVPAAVIGGGAAASVAAGGPAASGATAPSAAGTSYGPLAGGYGAATTEATVPSALAAGGAGITPAVVAASAAPSIWKTILDVGSVAGPIAAGIYGAKTQADANKAALDAQAKAAQDALDFTKEQAADLKRRRAPFEAASLGSLQTLYRNMGLGELPTLPPTATPAQVASTMPGTAPPINVGGPGFFPPQNLPQNIPDYPKGTTPAATMPPMGGTLASLNGQQQAMVKMRAPDGSIGMVPQDKVTQATAAGGVLV